MSSTSTVLWRLWDRLMNTCKRSKRIGASAIIIDNIRFYIQVVTCSNWAEWMYVDVFDLTANVRISFLVKQLDWSLSWLLFSGTFSARWTTWLKTSQRSMKGPEKCQTPSTHLPALEWSLMRCRNISYHFWCSWSDAMSYEPVALCMCVSSERAAGRAGEAGEESGWEHLWQWQNGGAAPLS